MASHITGQKVHELAVAAAAQEAFDAAAEIVSDGIVKVGRNGYAHPALAESDARRVTSYEDDVRLIQQLTEEVYVKERCRALLRQFETLIREANHTTQLAHYQYQN